MVQRKLKKELYSWNDFEDMVEQITHHIKDGGLEFDFIVGIPRGGLVLGVALSCRLNIPFMELNEFIAKPFNNAKILLVDDIAANGRAIKDKLRHFDRLDTTMFTLLYKEQSIIKPHYFIKQVGDDIRCVFPWEIKQD